MRWSRSWSTSTRWVLGQATSYLTRIVTHEAGAGMGLPSQVLLGHRGSLVLPAACCWLLGDVVQQRAGRPIQLRRCCRQLCRQSSMR